VKKLLFQNKQFLLYCVIGASGVTLDFGSYSLLLKFSGLHYQAANAIGYTAGTLLSFVLNARYNFCIRDWLVVRFFSFLGVALLGWLVSAALLRLLVGQLSVNPYLAKLGTLAVVVLLQYNLNRRFSFRKQS
jgi:putative flippase GtrA